LLPPGAGVLAGGRLRILPSCEPTVHRLAVPGCSPQDDGIPLAGRGCPADSSARSVFTGMVVRKDRVGAGPVARNKAPTEKMASRLATGWRAGGSSFCPLHASSVSTRE
jgi:hypothetical protein